jgi:hypothetical protein
VDIDTASKALLKDYNTILGREHVTVASFTFKSDKVIRTDILVPFSKWSKPALQNFMKHFRNYT